MENKMIKALEDEIYYRFYCVGAFSHSSKIVDDIATALLITIRTLRRADILNFDTYNYLHDMIIEYNVDVVDKILN